MGNKKIILVADDDSDLLELMNVSLNAKGFEVLEAQNGKEVMEWLDRKADQISLILLDIVMPEMDGFEVLEAMQKKDEFKKIPVIVCSNLESDADRQAALSMGAKDFYEKVKFDPSQIAEKVRKVLGD